LSTITEGITEGIPTGDFLDVLLLLLGPAEEPGKEMLAQRNKAG
jgi:hypothetical protein